MSTTNNYDVVVSNMAETFNGYIIHARSLHVIDLLKRIRAFLMERLASMNSEMEKYRGVVCPRVQKAKFEKAKVVAADCSVRVSNSASSFHGIDTLTVDIANETCTCKEWDMIGIPCKHAVVAIFFLRHKAEDYVSMYYKKTTYLKSYEASSGQMSKLLTTHHQSK